MAASTAELATEIRKLRKKLRQIENLERLDRQLGEEETIKVRRKSDFRKKLQKLICQQEENNLESGQSEDLMSTSRCSEADSSLLSDWSTSMTVSEAEVSFNKSVVDEKDIPESKPDNLEQEKITERESIEKLVVQDEASLHTASPKQEKPIQNKKTKASPCPVPQKEEQPMQEKKRKAEADKTPVDPLKVARQEWRQSTAAVRELLGHNDIITALRCEGSLLVSASRDTTVKVWDLDQGTELCNLGGHTGSVTSVFLMTKQASTTYCELIGLSGKNRLVISGSADCSFKIWNIETGQTLKSVYTYNPITQIDCDQKSLIITGSDGGKLELWDMENGSNVHSEMAHEDSVTGLKIVGSLVYSSAADGAIVVHKLDPSSFNCKMSCIFKSENIKSVSGSLVTPRNILSMDVYVHSSGDKVLFGDDAVNVKVLLWKTGTVWKLPNHTDEFASTDALCCYDNLLVSSSYNLDTGLGYLNVRCLPKGDYLATLDDEETERIICLASTRSKSGNLLIISGGLQLKVWDIQKKGQRSGVHGGHLNIVSPRYIPHLGRPGRDSDVESETDFSESDDMDSEEVNNHERRKNSNSEENKGWMSWCSVL